MRVLLVDILCRESVRKVNALLKQHALTHIYFVNCARNFSQTDLSRLRKKISVPLEQLDQIVEGEEKIDGDPLYELIYLQMVDLINRLVARPDVVQSMSHYCRQNKITFIKFKEHLRETACHHVIKVSEMILIAKKLFGGEDYCFLLRDSFMRPVFEDVVGRDKVNFFPPWQSHRCGLTPRPRYLYDRFYDHFYCQDRLSFFGKTLAVWLGAGINRAVTQLLPSCRMPQASSGSGQANIGVDIIQSRVRLDAINDVYWLRDSGIDPKTVFGIEVEDYDAESQKALDSLGIHRSMLCRNPLKFIVRIWRNFKSGKRAAFVTQDFKSWLKVLPDVLRLWKVPFTWGLSGWLEYEKINFKVRTAFWESVFRQTGIRIFWSMHDFDHEKLVKAQAMENVDGIFAGSHWTNFPLICVANEQKCYDAFFVWGPYFPEKTFVNYPFMATFSAGYPLDYYFALRKKRAEDLRQKYPGKFIISYQDNVVSNDFGYSPRMQSDIYHMLFDLMNKYDHVVVFMKPKRKSAFEEDVKNFSQMQKFINNGRIAVFAGEIARTKAVSAEIGMASDLVISLGIGTTSCECQFAGVLSFHADLAGFRNNEFGKQGLNKFVFRDTATMRKRIEEMIEGKSSITAQDYRKDYEPLDPFQDGKAYLRTGFVLRQMQMLFAAGANRGETIQAAQKQYEKILTGAVEPTQARG